MLRGAIEGPLLRRALSAAQVANERSQAEAPDDREGGPVDYYTTINLCEKDRALRDVVCAPAVARQAAAALGVERVRLLYDQLFVKPPGGVLTMWHQDQVYVPIDTSDVIEPGQVGMVRGWSTLTPLPPDVGGLHFVDGSHRFGPVDLATVTIAAPGRRDSATVEGQELSITEYGAYAAGDTTLHAGYTVHGSAPNRSDSARYAVAVAYIPDGTRVAEPADWQQELAIALHTPGLRPGDVIDTAVNPLLWTAEAA
jgi:ectoine hydroxylase-related dioxygenase (phytanoyl-CoA dioxygenase family)